MKISAELTKAIVTVTEQAAIAAFDWVGKQDKIAADAAAVNAMRRQLNKLHINGRIVIGEGEIDEAPMLYIGEQVGLGEGLALDIAVDPIDGTRMVAVNEQNAIAVLAAGEAGCFLQAPDMYMEKMVVGHQAKGAINLDLPLDKNLTHVAMALNKDISALSVAILDKPRHQNIILMMENLGVNVVKIPDGDVLASVYATMDNHSIDMMYGIGGAPEGIISAAIARSLKGDMQAKLISRSQAKGNTQQNIALAHTEYVRCLQMGCEIGVTYSLEQLVKSQNIMFCATAITESPLIKGVRKSTDRNITTETFVINGQSHQHQIVSQHHSIVEK